MNFSVPSNIKFVLDALKDKGFEAYLVGGCVRDMLLSITPYDYDITTSATPEEIKTCFKKTVDTGIKHGTVTVIEDGIPIEVTTYRTEGGYNDLRRPDSVTFVTDINKDLSRRDFTVNAIAYSPAQGFVDPFGGIGDAKNRILKAVGNPDERFSEDALRIMRLFRFACVLGFTIEQNTEKAALRCSEGLKKISAERIYCELIKLSLGKNISAALPLFESGALEFLGIKGLKNPHLILKLSNKNLKLYALFSFCSQNKAETLRLLKASNEIKDYFSKLDYSVSAPTANKADIKRLLRVVEDPQFVFDTAEFLSVVYNKSPDFLINTVNNIIEMKEPYKISDLDISGDDLKKIGLAGKEIKERLEYLLEKVTQDKDLNRKNILLTL